MIAPAPGIKSRKVQTVPTSELSSPAIAPDLSLIVEIGAIVATSPIGSSVDGRRPIPQSSGVDGVSKERESSVVARRKAKWLGSVGLLAIAGILLPRVAADSRDRDFEAGKRPTASLTVGTTATRPVRIVVSVLSREPGPWPITLRAVSTPESVGPRWNRIPTEFRTIPPVDDLPRPDSAPTTVSEPDRERSFFILTGGDPADPARYERVRGRLAVAGRSLQIYQDADDPDAPALANDLLAAYESVILPRCEPWIGRPRDVDGDGRLTILLSSRIRGLGDGGEPVTGCVRPADFLDRMPEPFGNRCDLITIDSRLEPGPHARTILAHEFAHAVVAGRKGARPDGSRDGSAEEDWLDEALAHVVEAQLNLSRSNLDHRIAAFQRSTERYGLVIADYQAAGASRSPGHRGAAFGFLDACTRRFGPELIARLANAPEIGVPSLERATGEPLERLLVAWARDDARRARVDDPIPADGPATTWLAHGTTFHAVDVIPGRTEGLRIEIDAPDGIAVALDVVGVEPD